MSFHIVDDANNKYKIDSGTKMTLVFTDRSNVDIS